MRRTSLESETNKRLTTKRGIDERRLLDFSFERIIVFYDCFKCSNGLQLIVEILQLVSDCFLNVDRI